MYHSLCLPFFAVLLTSDAFSFVLRSDSSSSRPHILSRSPPSVFFAASNPHNRHGGFYFSLPQYSMYAFLTFAREDPLSRHSTTLKELRLAGRAAGSSGQLLVVRVYAYECHNSTVRAIFPCTRVSSSGEAWQLRQVERCSSIVKWRNDFQRVERRGSFIKGPTDVCIKVEKLP